MKRSAATLTIVLLLAAACAAAVGCGGNTGKARQYMTVADQSYEDAAAKGDRLQKHEEAALPALMSGDPAALLQAAPRIADIQQSIDTYRASAQTTKADYAKITALSGVAEYKTYANMMIAALDTILASLDTGQGLLDGVSKLVQQLSAGQQVDMQSMKAGLFSKIKQALDQGQNANRLEAKAKAYQTAHKLLE